ncbi:MAG: hypothetical protein QG652_1232 [Pseudomonadota bacterium]|nr:hypothetical protein [Pseudomonadota bacterium]
MHTIDDKTPEYYSGPERRQAHQPRRHAADRRYRLRNESLISDFRNNTNRRMEDEEGFVETGSLNNGNARSGKQL